MKHLVIPITITELMKHHTIIKKKKLDQYYAKRNHSFRIEI